LIRNCDARKPKFCEREGRARRSTKP
jgi:hypothetical protein